MLLREAFLAPLREAGVLPFDEQSAIFSNVETLHGVHANPNPNPEPYPYGRGATRGAHQP